jgi:hypothetical protein
VLELQHGRLAEARAADEGLDRVGLAERELPRLAGPRRLRQPAREQHRPERGRPRVPRRGRPGRERESAARPEHASRLAQRTGGIGDEHVAAAAHDRVDARVLEVERLHVDDAVLDARELPPPGRVDHRRREVRRDHAGDAAGERRGDVAGARGELEHDVVPPRLERGEERVGHGRHERRDALALRLPARRRHVPAAADVVGARYAATPLKCGRMSRPYASSVSSWPWVIR